MALSVKVDYSAYPPDTELGIVGVGVLVNGGEAIDLDEGHEAAFYAINGYTLDSEDAASEGMTVSGSADFTPPELPAEEPPVDQGGQPPETPVPPDQQSGLPPGTAPEEGGA